MKKQLACIALAAPLFAWAQVPMEHIPMFRAATFDAAAVAQDDQAREQAGELPLYGRTLPLNVGSADGAWSTEAGERTCRMVLSSPGALAMELFMEDVAVPEGATLRITDREGHELHGPFGVMLPQGAHSFSTPLVAGDAWVLEYREPANAVEQGHFFISDLGHAYRDAGPLADREGSCHVNVACEPESDGWEGAIRATVRISVVVPQGTGWCTGTLVNNVREDCAPYILTAFHCGRQSTTANFNQYKFYFNFQYATCNGGAYSTAQYITGAQLKASSDDYAPQYQGLGGSDFMLLRTNVDIPAAFDPYWAGWDATNISSVADDGVCIHHPTGAPKRISSYTQTLTTGHPMASSGLMSHYKLTWAQTPHGWGITEVGSSGSGLFKQKAGTGPVLIGTCTGNTSGMSCSNHTGYAYFGKMSYHWTGNPNAANAKLKAWLDPDNTGTLVLGGSDEPCAQAAGMDDIRPIVAPLAWPNPAHEAVSFHTGTDGQTDYAVIDATGRTACAGTIIGPLARIPVSSIPEGIYSIRITSTTQGNRSLPLVVMH